MVTLTQKKDRQVKRAIRELDHCFQYLHFNTIVSYCNMSGLHTFQEKYLVYVGIKHKIQY